MLLARNTKWSTPALVGGIVFAVVVRASRLYLGVHYPSDILGAVLGPIAVIVFVSGLWNRYGMTVLRRIPILARIGPIPNPATQTALRHTSSRHSAS